MESLANYESDDENKDHADEDTIGFNVKVTTELDTNYDDVEMDESDEETNNNNVPVEFVDYYGGSEVVLPEDAPLVFRSANEPREEVRCVSLERRNSSDMEMDDDESEEEEIVEEGKLPQEEKIENDIMNDKITNVLDGRLQRDDSQKGNLNSSQSESPCAKNIGGYKRDLHSASKCHDADSRLGSFTNSWEARLDRTKRKDDEGNVDGEIHQRGRASHHGSDFETESSSRRESSHKRAHSPDRHHSADKGNHESRDSHRRSSRSPERSWKNARLEKKAAALNKMGIHLRPESGSDKSSRHCLGDQLRSQIKEVEAKTGITLPSYYNPSIMNPLKYAQQVQKRKLLWSNKSNETKPKEAVPSSCSSPWDATTFKGDNDGKMTEKFKRLMGIKAEPAAVKVKCEQKEMIEKQEEMFSNMEAQYQVARMVTHTHRGVGLGYGTYQARPSLQKNS